MPILRPQRLAVAIAMAIIAFTLAWRSSNRSATRAESRSSPRVSWVRSLEPIEKPSKRSAKASALITLLGNSHITYTSRPFSPRTSPCSAMAASTRSPSSGVRQKGTIGIALVRPMVSRTRLRAWHSSAKAARKAGA